MSYEEIRDRILSGMYDEKNSSDSENTKKDGFVELNEEELDSVRGGIPYEEAKDKILKDINGKDNSLEDDNER